MEVYPWELLRIFECTPERSRALEFDVVDYPPFIAPERLNDYEDLSQTPTCQ
jgi:hypothetical protein